MQRSSRFKILVSIEVLAPQASDDRRHDGRGGGRHNTWQCQRKFSRRLPDPAKRCGLSGWRRPCPLSGERASTRNHWRSRLNAPVGKLEERRAELRRLIRARRNSACSSARASPATAPSRMVPESMPGTKLRASDSLPGTREIVPEGARRSAIGQAGSAARPARNVRSTKDAV